MSGGKRPGGGRGSRRPRSSPTGDIASASERDDSEGEDGRATSATPATSASGDEISERIELPLRGEPLEQRIVRQRQGSEWIADLPPLDYGSIFADRTAEVAMLVMREPGWMLLQSKRSYPTGLFRVPTGTIEASESAEATMRRELHEEANLVPSSARRLFTLRYTLGGRATPFYSEGWLIESCSGELRPNDPSEAISAWREGQLVELATICAELRGLDGRWRPWGWFRSAVHELYYELLVARA
jgi:8-oxo-dGTP pyrophosphatase MutT (NUDIX family)